MSVVLNATNRVAVHAALADHGRLAIVDRLLLGDASPSELQVLLSMSSNLIAHHLGVLEHAGVVQRTRSHADRRRTYIRLNAEALELMIPAARRSAKRVVFVCTQNSARSQLAVAVWNRSKGTLPAASAGTHPVAKVHPAAVAAARRRGLRIRPRSPQPVSDVVSAGDLVIAVCDNAHEELPPDVHRIHWSIPDPVAAGVPEAFDEVLDNLTDRIDRLVPALQSH